MPTLPEFSNRGYPDAKEQSIPKFGKKPKNNQFPSPPIPDPVLKLELWFANGALHAWQNLGFYFCFLTSSFVDIMKLGN